MRSTYQKYFTLSYDDGLQQDKEIISLLRKYGVKATFNLNSGLFGQQMDIEYISTFGFRTAPEGTGRKNFFHPFRSLRADSRR